MTSSPAALQARSDAVTPDALSAALLQAKGNLALACERLHLSIPDCLALLNDPLTSEKLSLAIRGQVTLAAFNAIDELAIALPVMLPGMEPNDAFKAFSTLIAAVAQLTAPPKNTTALIQQNNISFTPEDAEVARGKLLHFVSNIESDIRPESAPADAAS